MHGDQLKYPERFTRLKEGSQAQASTRRYLKHQEPGAGFTTAPAVNCWSCICGGANPPRAITCRSCGEARP